MITVKVIPCSFALQILKPSREKNSIQASQRRMERKLKELNATLDQERSQHVEQRDQVNIKTCIQNSLKYFMQKLEDAKLLNKRNILTFVCCLAQNKMRRLMLLVFFCII